MNLTDEEKKFLISIARNSIIASLGKNKESKLSIPSNPVYHSKCGAFVTLTCNDNLRGCIGYIISEKPLHKTISDSARHAAFEDPRFSPIAKEELPDIKIEISILSEPFPMKDYEDIEIGKHGLILEEPRRALLLPQVPIEHSMDREQFLSALCRKAGLYSNYWKETKLKISLFTATVFSEKDWESK